MGTTSEQIDLWRRSPTETQHLEFKEAKTQFDSQKLYRYCVALANEGGGQLILGISDKPPREVVGTTAFSNPVATAAKLYKILRFRVDIEPVDHPDGRVLVFHIPSRPTGTPYAHEGAYWMRAGDELVTMSQDYLRKIFDEGRPEWLNGVAKAGCTDEAIIRLLDTQSYYDLQDRAYPRIREEVLRKFEQECLITAGTEGWDITRIGALLFAKNVASFPELRGFVA